MKRLVSIILATFLLVSVFCAASADGVTFTTSYFTIQLPDDWVIDTEDLEKEDGMECLGYFGEDQDVGFVAAAYLVYYEDLKDLALWSSDAEEMEAYKESVLEDFADDNPEYLDTVMAGKIPFILIKVTDDIGEYLYADTMTNGYAIQFEAYIASDSDEKESYPLSRENIELFKTILTTFKPVT